MAPSFSHEVVVSPSEAAILSAAHTARSVMGARETRCNGRFHSRRHIRSFVVSATSRRRSRRRGIQRLHGLFSSLPRQSQVTATMRTVA